MIKPWLFIAYDADEPYHNFCDLRRNTQLMLSFWDYLAWVIFKKEWLKQFNKFEIADDGRKVVSVKLKWVDPKFWSNPKRKSSIPVEN